jgi:hypothetical protein
LYDKSANGRATELYSRAYTRDLDLLWEKQVLQTKEDGPPALFDVCATTESRFAIASKTDYWNLRVHEYGTDGVLLRTTALDGDVGTGKVCVDYLPGRIIVASTARVNDEEGKIKILALEPFSESAGSRMLAQGEIVAK